MNLTLKTRLADLIENAILYFEPRIDLEEVDVDTSSEADGVLMILIRYRVRNTNSRYNYVYPFYKNEASQIYLNR